jgi:hypothetical protein
MPKEPITLYSNVVSIRRTDTELVFEFGTVFPPQAGSPAGPENTRMEVRVVMPAGVIKDLAAAFRDAAASSPPASSSVDTPSAKAR